MTAKEKAIDLVDRFWSCQVKENAKQCALICVDEMLGIYDIEGYDGDDIEMAYLEEVKKEINKL
tara:strand:+ start:240 stop:431 length:192 start_codon:yes stop_codon:yes gene_type:complete